MTRLRKWTPVEVQWSDAHGGDSGWERLGSQHGEPATIRTVGMLASDNRKGIVVCLSLDLGSRDIGAYVFIPRANVLSMTALEPA